MFKLVVGEHSYLKDIYNPLEVPLVIGKFCSISFNITILGEDHACISHPEYITTYPFDALWDIKEAPQQINRGQITIENDVWIGMNTCIRPGVTIHNGAIVGAGTLVTKDVRPYEIVFGNPMVHHKFRFSLLQITKLLEIKWWDWPEEKIRKEFKLFNNINEFILNNIQQEVKE